VGTERAATIPDRAPVRGTDTQRRESAGCAPGFDVSLDPATVGMLMGSADGGTRERLTAMLQARHGNAAVQRLLAGSSPLAVQRWAVTLPAGTTDCARVVSYMDANSPYRRDSGWARTNVRFSWGGDPSYTTTDGVTTASVTGPTVTPTVSVDMPRWAPSDPAMASAWSAMTASLRAHEARHEGIAATWEATLRSNLSSLVVTVADRQIGTFRAAVQAEWNGWLAQHQAEQTGIDPFAAVLDCSGEPAAAPDAAPITGLDDAPDLGGE
jgi:predicted secreted Zn-dependent protease